MTANGGCFVHADTLPCGCASVPGVLNSPLEALIAVAAPECPHHRSGDTILVLAHRVLVTGSRYWTDEQLIYADLEYQLSYAHTIRAVLVVVHGNNPKGADAAAARWAQWAKPRGVVEEPVDADWTRDCAVECRHAPRRRADGSTYCPAAGNLRNQAMVDRNATLCLAYPLGGTGTADCMRRAKRAGILVYNRAESPLV